MLVYIDYDMGFAYGFACAWYDNANVYVELFSGSPTTFLKLIMHMESKPIFLCSIKEQLSLSNDLGNVLIYKGFASRKFLIMYMLVLV